MEEFFEVFGEIVVNVENLGMENAICRVLRAMVCGLWILGDILIDDFQIFFPSAQVYFVFLIFKSSVVRK